MKHSSEVQHFLVKMETKNGAEGSVVVAKSYSCPSSTMESLVTAAEPRGARPTWLVAEASILEDRACAGEAAVALDRACSPRL